MYENKGFKDGQLNYLPNVGSYENHINSIDTRASMCAASSECNSYYFYTDTNKNPINNFCSLNTNNDTNTLQTLSSLNTFIKRQNKLGVDFSWNGWGHLLVD